MNKSNAQGIATRKRNEQARRERHRQEMEEVKAQAAADVYKRQVSGPR